MLLIEICPNINKLFETSGLDLTYRPHQAKLHHFKFYQILRRKYQSLQLIQGAYNFLNAVFSEL